MTDRINVCHSLGKFITVCVIIQVSSSQYFVNERLSTIVKSCIDFYEFVFWLNSCTSICSSHTTFLLHGTELLPYSYLFCGKQIFTIFAGLILGPQDFVHEKVGQAAVLSATCYSLKDKVANYTW